MSVAALLLTMSVYMLIPMMPLWLMKVENFTPLQTGVSMGVFGLGLYLFGAQCSWLVQRYRRNVVCLWAMAAVALGIALLWYIDDLHTVFVEFWVILLQRFLLGAVFGLAQMILLSTLVIDMCESYRRTEANYSTTWVIRLAVAAGPLAGLACYQYQGFDMGVVIAAALAALSVLMVKSIDFPFRSPEEDVHLSSLDRFFLPQGTVLFCNFMLVSTVTGMIFTLVTDVLFYVFMGGGLLVALLTQRLVFRDAELKSEIISGLVLLMAAILILFFYPSSWSAPFLAGIGVGVISSRFLLFFIKLSRHCQRGTSQSTYFLGWETGISLGMAVGYGLFYQCPQALLYTALGLTVCALMMYHLYTHQWFVSHKNR